MVIQVGGFYNAESTGNTMYLNDEVYCCHYNPTLVHQTVVTFHSSFRRACSSQKNRGTVRHSTRKLYKQKGLGRARVGMSSSPLRRGGGRAFPNLGTEVFGGKTNKKTYKCTLRGILSHLSRVSKLSVVESLHFSSINISSIINDPLPNNKPVQLLLVVTERELTKDLYLSVRNLPAVHLVTHEEMNPRVLLLFDRIILTETSALKVQELLQ